MRVLGLALAKALLGLRDDRSGVAGHRSPSVLSAMLVGDFREDRVCGFLVTVTDRFLRSVNNPGVAFVGYNQRQHGRVREKRVSAEHPPLTPFEVYKVCLSQSRNEVA